MPPVAAGSQLPYDAVLVLTFNTLSSLSSTEAYRDQILEAAAATKSRLLIYLPKTELWNSLLINRSQSFDSVQTLLSEIYVLAQTGLPEDAAVDVVIEALRAEALSPESMQTLKERVPMFLDHAVAAKTKVQEDSRMYQEGSKADASLANVALGGTFDHLHPGHKILLTMACWIARRRTIVGITDDVLLKNKSDRDLLESLDARTANVRHFLLLVCPHLQHDTPVLQDVYGPTATDPDVQGVLVSEETRKGAASIAEKREQDGLSTLQLFVIKVISPESVLDPDSVSKEDLVKAKIGSTQIRRRLKAKMMEERVEQT